MGKKSRDKGNRVERQFVHRLNDVDISACRVPLSGAAGGDFSGDIVVEGQKRKFIAEVKSRRNGCGFATIEKWLADNDLLFLKSDRNEPIVAMSWDVFLEIFTNS